MVHLAQEHGKGFLLIAFGNPIAPEQVESHLERGERVAQFMAQEREKLVLPAIGVLQGSFRGLELRHVDEIDHGTDLCGTCRGSGSDAAAVDFVFSLDGNLKLRRGALLHGSLQGREHFRGIETRGDVEKRASEV